MVQLQPCQTEAIDLFRRVATLKYVLSEADLVVSERDSTAKKKIK